MSNKATRSIDTIQALRAVAAVLVVWVHAREQFPWLKEQFPSVFGAYGVDLFFVISGFIMVVSTRNRDVGFFPFFIRRLIRVAPLYWIATAILLSFALLAPQLVKTAVVSWPHVGASLLFVPMESPAMPGKMFPLLIPGWSLNYEMAFYLLFGFSIAVAGSKKSYLVIFALLAASAYGSFSEPGGVLGFFCDPIILTFGAGILLAEGYTRDILRPGVTGAMVVGVCGTAVYFIVSQFEYTNRFWAAGIPAAILVATALLVGDLIKWPKWILTLGDASYSLYLFHTFVLGATRYLAGPFMRNQPNESAGWLFMIVSLYLSSVVAVLIHKRIERPLTKWLQQFSAR